jgi:MFS family permease
MNLYREVFLNIKKFPSAFWVVIAATLLNQAGNMAFVFIVLYATQHLGFTLSQGASAFAVVSASMLISGILAGNLIDRFGAGRMMIGSVFLNGIVLLSIPMIHSYYSLVGACIVWGLVFGIYRPASQTLVSYLSPDGLQKITFSLYRLASNLGMSVGPAVGGYLAAHSFAAIFVANGSANILAGIILLLGLSGSMWIAHRPALEQKKIFTIKWIKYDSALRWFLIGMIPVSMVFFQHESKLSVYLSQDLKLPISLYGWLFTINTLLIVFFELLLNIATLHWPYRVNFILGTIFITAGFAGLYFATSMWNIIVLSVTWTIGEMILLPSASSYIAEIAPEGRRGSYMSSFSTSSNLGMLIGPWAGAIVMQQISGVALWVVCGVWGMFSIAVFCLLIEPKSKKINKI